MFRLSITEETSSAETVVSARTIRSTRPLMSVLRIGLVFGVMLGLIFGLPFGWTKDGLAQVVSFGSRAMLKAMATGSRGGSHPVAKPTAGTEFAPKRGPRPEALPVNPITGNLLANPGAELGSIADWTAGGPGGPPTVDSGTLDPGINPHTGSYDFVGYTGASDSLAQTVSLLAQGITAADLDSGTLSANISFWEQGLNQAALSDNASVTLTFLDASNATISTVNSGVVDSHDGTWENQTGIYAIPVGTRSITYTMNFTREVGTSLDAFLDDNALFITTDTGLTLSTGTVHFGNVGVGTTSAAQVVTVSNAQTTTINISQIISELGANPSDFIQTNNCPAALTPGASCAITITFTPDGVGPKSAGIAITDDSSPPQQQIVVDGTGTGGILQVNPGSLKTIAGNGTVGYNGDGGGATVAELTQPNGVAFDPFGNLYIADDAANVVRKVDTAGNITTFAGNGTAGFSGDGLAATSAELQGPDSVASDAAGNIYIQDTLNYVVRKVSVTTGLITTIAGTPGAPGHAGDGGLATAAKFNQNQGARFDSAGNLYVPQCLGASIRKIDTAGNISTVAGNFTEGFLGDGGAATAAELQCPSGVTIDAAGNLYIADEFNYVIRKVSVATGLISTIAGTPGVAGFSGDNGLATAATFNEPNDVVVDAAGNLYVADAGNNRVRKIDTSGVITTVAGGLNNAGSAAVNTPLGVTVDPAGNVYFSDSGKGKVEEVFPQGVQPFPATVVGATAAAQTLTISNIGNIAVTVPSGSFTTSGSAAGDFALTGGTCLTGATLAVGGTCTLTVGFTPTAVGLRTVTVAIADSALNSPQTFVESGTGTPATPTIAWAAPANIVYGTALNGVQLDAAATGVGGVSVEGSFAYTPPAGTVLGVGAHTLGVVFTSADPNYLGGSGSVPITVTQATPVLTWATPAAITTATPLSATQLNAAATDINGAAVPGVYTYTPAAGTLLPVGTQTLSVTFTPTDTVDFATPPAKTVSIVVTRAPAVATTTTLAVTVGESNVTTVAAGTVVDLTATVATAGGAVVNPGQVAFCDATAATCTDIHLLGIAQLVGSGAGAGTAIYRFVPGIGAHSYKAVFLGTGTALGSASAAAALAVTGTYPTATTIAQSGVAGNYTLTATTTSANGANVGQTGTVSFLDSSNGNAVLGTGVLGAGTVSSNFPAAATLGVGPFPDRALPGDLNGDGKVDLVIGNGPANTISVFLGNGDGTFTAVASPAVPNPTRAVLADFNGDGILDIAVPSPTGVDTGAVYIFLGNGDGTFGNPVITSMVSNFVELATGDFNSDGIADLVGINSASNGFSILLGNGDGTFTVGSGPATGGSVPESVAVGDFNGDGKADLAVGVHFDSGVPAAVNIFLGNGDGTFARAADTSIGAIQPTGLAVADLNKDGKTDLVVSDFNGGLSVLLGNGDGTFTAAIRPAAGSQPGRVVVADFNGDGNPDIATANFGDNTATVLLGNGDGTFTLLANPATGAQPSYISAADFNGDGRADLVTSNYINEDAGVNGSATVLLTQVTQTAVAMATAVAPLGLGTHEAVASYPGDVNYGTSVSAATGLTGIQLAPVIAWAPAVATIPYGTALGASQLNAVATVGGAAIPGTFAYTPAAGTVLGAGAHTLGVVFTPTSAIYSVATGTTAITVTQAVPAITWAAPAGIPYGTALSAAQLDATVAGVSGGALAGTLVYTPPAGTVPAPGTQTLSVVFTPTDAVDYATATASVPIAVGGFALSSIAPAAVLLASADTTITLTGTGFVPSSVVMANGANVATAYVGPTMLTAVLPAALLTKAAALAVTVLDPSLGAATAAQVFTVLPVATGATLTGPGTTPPGSQPTVTLAVANPYPLPITATFNLSFASAGSTAVDDPAIQFSTGGRTFSYTVAANSTSVPPVQLQAGTDAGTITIAATLTADGVDVTPGAVAPVVIVVPAVVPVISGTTIAATGTTLTVVVHGFSNTREVSQAAFDFTAATGDTLATPSVTIPATPIFSTWYTDPTSDTYGSTFTYTQIFNTSSDASTVGQVKVTLTNSVGASLVSTSP